MKVIGAGLPKTGTKSLAAALRHLGCTVHDVEEHWRFYCDEYNAAFEGNIPDFKKMYKDVDATTDSPACYFYKEIFNAFPDSKVILSVRENEETWKKSLIKTDEIMWSVLESPVVKLGQHVTPTGRKCIRLVQRVGIHLQNEVDYRKHNDDVIASIPANQLLVFNPREGWGPLCAFLEVKVPDIPFPQINEVMKVIGAGLPKTGTKSLAAALRHLGCTVHDVEEHWRYYSDKYNAAFEGNIPDFKKMYKDVDATTDSPACFFYKEIFEAFPDSKVILSVRENEETWQKSLLKTKEVIDSVLDSPVIKLCQHVTPTGREWSRLVQRVGIHLQNEVDYRKHNDDVIASIPTNQLLVFNPREGWVPLCAFLEVEVPDIPFPQINVSSKDVSTILLNSWTVRRMRKELVLVMSLLVLLIACACAVFFSS
ncbi:predicted protein [Nematostella vectensis]|uniref:Sulfotransferase n=1 Tax=Nematostella vectensis TaxID=45351 RepID=A7SBL0_NEMVE|nr:predicted protein [Nematostella vectensis]|eukprot:XP_001630928.1 predicted protein [Nematostella vectensis]